MITNEEYSKLIKTLYGLDLKHALVTPEKSPFTNLLINRYEDLKELKIDTTELNMEWGQKITLDTLDMVKNKLQNDLLINPSGSYYTIFTTDNRILSNGNRSLLRLLNDKDYGTIAAHIVITRLGLKVRKEDIQPPKEVDFSKMNKEIMKEGLSYINEDHRRMMESKIAEINTRNREIERESHHIKNLKEDIKTLEGKMLLGNEKEKLEEKVIKFITSHKLIDQSTITKSTRGFSFYTTKIPIYKINRNYIKKSKDNLFKGNANFRKHLDGLADGTKHLLIDPYKIYFKFGNETIIGYDHSGHLRNPHEEMNCMGDHDKPFTDARKNNDIIKGLNILLEFLQSINFGDAGSHGTPEFCAVTEGDKIVYHPKEPLSAEKLAETIPESNSNNLNVASARMSRIIEGRLVRDEDTELTPRQRDERDELDPRIHGRIYPQDRSLDVGVNYLMSVNHDNIRRGDLEIAYDIRDHYRERTQISVTGETIGANRMRHASRIINIAYQRVRSGLDATID